MVVVTDIYGARPKAGEQKVDPKKFALDIARVSGRESLYAGSILETEQALPGILHQSDVVICMGAGDITTLATKITI